jgi:hypothetical protein
MSEPTPTPVPAPEPVKPWEGRTLAALAVAGSLAVGSFYAWLAQQPEARPAYQIEGQVRDADGNPVAGATVEAKIEALLPAPAPQGWVFVALSRNDHPIRVALVQMDDPAGYRFDQDEQGQPLGPGAYKVHLVSPAGYPELVQEFTWKEGDPNPRIDFDIRDLLREPSAAGGL